jgi:transcriptional regulator with XRE-family HTH domain
LTKLGGMWLHDYVRRKDVTIEGLAQKAGVDASTIWRAAHGKNKPHIDTARKIAAATDGLVSLEEVYGPTDRDPPWTSEEVRPDAETLPPTPHEAAR